MKTIMFDNQTLDEYIHSYFVLYQHNFSVRLHSMVKTLNDGKIFFNIICNQQVSDVNGNTYIRQQCYTYSENQVIEIINAIEKTHQVVGSLSNIKQGQVYNQNDQLIAAIDSFDVTLIPNEIKENEDIKTLTKK